MWVGGPQRVLGSNITPKTALCLLEDILLGFCYRTYRGLQIGSNGKSNKKIQRILGLFHVIFLAKSGKVIDRWEKLKIVFCVIRDKSIEWLLRNNFVQCVVWKERWTCEPIMTPWAYFVLTTINLTYSSYSIEAINCTYLSLLSYFLHSRYCISSIKPQHRLSTAKIMTSLSQGGTHKCVMVLLVELTNLLNYFVICLYHYQNFIWIQQTEQLEHSF